MRIFVSSSFEDLQEHRAAAIRVLRQLGHEVLAMEDIVAASATPLGRVVEMIDRSEAYVGLFAWRYGFVPGRDPAPTVAPAPAPMVMPPVVKDALYGQTSITHYEYLRAVERKLPILAFLLDEKYPWPPHLVDGFDSTPPAPASNADIRTLRQRLQLERVVSWFTTPADLEARVSAAVTTAGLTRQLDLQPAAALPPVTGAASDSFAEIGITNAIVAAGDLQRALKIDLATTWWSTRLYFIAALAERLTQVHRILVVDTSPAPSPPAAAAPPPLPPAGAALPPVAPAVAIQIEERFVGQLSLRAILATIGPKVPALSVFESLLQERPTSFNGDLRAEIGALIGVWYQAFGDQTGQHAHESNAKVDLTPEILRRWFGDSMLQQPVHIADLQRASVVDLLRLLDYPNDFVPVLTRHPPESPGGPTHDRVDVMDKVALNARLARSYLIELLDRARIS